MRRNLRTFPGRKTIRSKGIAAMWIALPLLILGAFLFLAVVVALLATARRRDEVRRSKEIERHHYVASAVMNAVCNYDPLGAAAVERFGASVARSSPCPFARTASLWGSDGWDTSLTLEQNVERSLPMLLQFCMRADGDVMLRDAEERRSDDYNDRNETRKAMWKTAVRSGHRRRSRRSDDGNSADVGGEPLDGFVVELRGEHGASVAAFSDAVRRVLTKISSFDPDPLGGALAPDGAKARVAHRGWHFRLAGVPLFVTTFAPCYGKHSPRFMDVSDAAPCDPPLSESSFVLLQPEASFARHRLPPDTPATRWKDDSDGGAALTDRDRARRAFVAAGRPYRIPPSVFYPPAEHIVAPANYGDPVVRWWVEPGDS